MIKLKSLLKEEGSGKVVLSLLKKDRQAEKTPEKAMKRAQRQFALGELGMGPKVFAIFPSGAYIAEYSPYPKLASAGVDVMEVDREISDKLDSVGVNMYDNHMDNLHYDKASGNFQLIDAGGMDVHSGSEVDRLTLPPKKPQDELNAFFAKHQSSPNIGEARKVYIVPKEILTFL